MKLLIFNIAFSIMFTSSFGKNVTGKFEFPFPKLTINNNNNINTLNLKLTCKKRFLGIKECAEQCYCREKNGVGCVGFLKFKNTKDVTFVILPPYRK